MGLRGAASAAPCGLAPGTSQDTPGGRWQLRASRSALGDLSWGHWGHLASWRAAAWCPQPCPVWQQHPSWWALGREACHPRRAAGPLALGLFEFLAGSPRGRRRATAVTGGPGGRGGHRRAVTATITSTSLPGILLALSIPAPPPSSHFCVNARYLPGAGSAGAAVGGPPNNTGCRSLRKRGPRVGVWKTSPGTSGLGSRGWLAGVLGTFWGVLTQAPWLTERG